MSAMAVENAFSKFDEVIPSPNAKNPTYRFLFAGNWL